MAINPNILLSGSADLTPGLHALAQIPAERQEREANELEINEKRHLQQLHDMLPEAQMAHTALEAGDIETTKRILENRVNRLSSQKRDPSHTQRTLEKIRLAEMTNDPGALEDAKQDIASILQDAQNRQIGDATRKIGAREIYDNGTIVASTQQGPIVWTPDGREVYGEEAARTIAEAQKADLQHRRDISDIDVQETVKKERVTQAARRDSELISDMSTRNRTSARDQRTITEALQLSAQAAGGITAGIKLKLSKLLPGVDVGNEAALDSALTQIALDQLQKFKGPTTDFEFGVTQDIAGSVTDPKTARLAKLNSLKRAAWFNQREYTQFVRHQRAGGSSDDFAFDFNEVVHTAKGSYTLQDLQETAVANHMSMEDVLQKLNEK